MEPDASTIIQRLLELGGQAGVLWVAIYFLVKQIKIQYDARISTLENRSDQCEEDRKALHSELHRIEQDRISLLETMLREQTQPIKPQPM